MNVYEGFERVYLIYQKYFYIDVKRIRKRVFGQTP